MRAADRDVSDESFDRFARLISDVSTTIRSIKFFARLPRSPTISLFHFADTSFSNTKERNFGKKRWNRRKRANAIVQLFRRVIAVVSREHCEQVSNEEKERDPAGRRERKKKERGPRGVEFGWNSSGGGTGGRGPFVVMATAGFHRLIDPPRSRSSTKPQSSPRSHHCLSHHLRNDGAVTTDTPLRTFSTGFVSIASNCVNDRPFSFLARLVRQRSRVTKFRRRSVLASLAGKSKRRSTRKTSERWKGTIVPRKETGEQQRPRAR